MGRPTFDLRKHLALPLTQLCLGWHIWTGLGNLISYGKNM
jgi:hypothetical protein